MHNAYSPSGIVIPWSLHTRLFAWPESFVGLTDNLIEWNLAQQVGAMTAIFRERLAIGMSLWDMEEQSGVSLNSAYQWLKGDRSPAVPNFVSLAETVGFEVVMRSILDPAITYDAANLRHVMAALDNARKEMALSTKGLRAGTSVASNSFYAWLKRHRDPTLERLIALAGPLGFSLVMRRKR